MKKFSKLVAVSAAAMTFGITGVSALNNTNVVNADNINTDNATLSSKIQEVRNLTIEKGRGNAEFWLETKNINSVANEVENNVNPETVKDHLQDKTADQLSGVYNANNENGDWYNYRDAYKRDSMTMTGETANEFQGLYQDGTKVLEEIDNYIGGKQQNSQSITQNNNNSNANKQNANNANAQNANNNANAQSNSSNKKDDVAANANNNAKNANVQGAVANKQNANNEANAQQNTVKGNANVESARIVASENESNSAKNQNNGAIAETQKENTTAAGETSTVVKTQAKSTNNSAIQKSNTPVFPQTGEQASEILAVAGGLIIAATAAGIVVYKKRN